MNDISCNTVEPFKILAPSGLPVDRLLGVLNAHPELWRRNTDRQNYPGSAHQDTRSILIKAPRVLLDASSSTTDRARAWFNDLNAEEDQALPPELLEAIDDILTPIVTMTRARKIARVMIVELKPGGTVSEHTDDGLYADHTDRVHVCVQGDKARLTVKGPDGSYQGRAVTGMISSYYHRAGDAVWLNTKLPHSAHNDPTGTPRINLIIDLISPELRALRTQGSYSIHPELLSECWSEIIPLCERHKDEIAHYKDIGLKVDFDAYERMEAAGKLRLYAVRSLPSWELIGYEVVMVGPNIHYADSIQAKVDVLYLAPEYRRGRLGMRLIDYADAMLKTEGVQVIYQHVKHSFNFGPMLMRLGYEPIEQIYGRRLDKE